MEDLTVVIPVYNEEEIIQHVIKDWIKHLTKLNINFTIHAYNDGSTDSSLQKLIEMDAKFFQVRVFDKPNSGHGPTILKGYREAKSTWIFQVDSDNEMKANHFYKLWNERHNFDFLIAKRQDRQQQSSRKIVTLISRILIKVIFSVGVTDVNSPYRLMLRTNLYKLFNSIPQKTFAPNTIISGFVSERNMKIFEIPIPIHYRTTGVASLNKFKLLKSSIISTIQILLFKLRY